MAQMPHNHKHKICMIYGTLEDFPGFLQISRKGQPNEKIVSISELTDSNFLITKNTRHFTIEDFTKENQDNYIKMQDKKILCYIRIFLLKSIYF